MNYQISSNQILDYYDNKVNNFIFEVDPPIDAHTGGMYMQVNYFFFYPTTIPNGDDDCFFSLIEFVKFKMCSHLQLHVPKKIVQKGRYSIADLYNINKQWEQFGVFLNLEKNKISTSYSFYYQYWCNKKKINNRES